MIEAKWQESKGFSSQYGYHERALAWLFTVTMEILLFFNYLIN